jgi:hypothetical protein
MVKLESFSVKGIERIIPEIGEILSEVSVKPAEILNPSSSRFFFFFDFTLLNFPGRILIKFFNS